MSRLPFMTLDSDVVDVVYMTWLVDEALAAPFAPPGARLWSYQGRTPLTVLTYRHGHFGPRWMGPLRRVMPSPLQSNWRLYLAEPLSDAPPVPTVAFVYNVMDSLAHVAGTRLFSDALPSHWPASFDFRVNPDEAIVDIAPGDGSAPRLAARAVRAGEAVLSPPWSGMFHGWSDAIVRLASQDAAVVEVPTAEGAPARSALATIDLPVDVASVEPLLLDTQTLDCPLLQRLDADPEALCFLLPSVRFSALSERLLRAST
ncbi:DUF2071 domain-containing protein [Comamonas sp. B-9]|uniref:DUF2071 domain-containing protein n=1 Tax=Comamonas sp. B-9 TaxID=1055192 RepID=UPI001EF9E2D9|nr:DUF2071 domain-containing protein [Comamonas sp. B-9]